METIENEEVKNEIVVDETTLQENNAEAETNEDEKKKTYPTQTVLTIRAIVGAYVFYLAYQIATSEDAKSIPMWIVVVLFFIAGAGLVIMSVKHFIRGEYEGKNDEKR